MTWEWNGGGCITKKKVVSIPYRVQTLLFEIFSVETLLVCVIPSYVVYFLKNIYIYIVINFWNILLSSVNQKKNP